jgi:hypothetical protein
VSNDRRMYFTLDEKVRLRDEKDPESNNKMFRVLSVIAIYKIMEMRQYNVY